MSTAPTVYMPAVSTATGEKSVKAVSTVTMSSSGHGSDSISEKIPQSPQAAFHSKQGLERMKGVAHADEEVYRVLSRLGSMPPNCVHKCGSCIPCHAIQIPTNTNHFGVQYANYEPEGWKCKCGTSFFNP